MVCVCVCVCVRVWCVYVLKGGGGYSQEIRGKIMNDMNDDYIHIYIHMYKLSPLSFILCDFEQVAFFSLSFLKLNEENNSYLALLLKGLKLD